MGKAERLEVQICERFWEASGDTNEMTWRDEFREAVTSSYS